jgi:hyperosmotically inducible periplasmic protein
MLRRHLVGVGAVMLAAVLAAACSQSDPGVTTAVKSKLAADDTVKSYRIDVDTKDRVVTLSGAVDTPDARNRALEIARGTEGVRDVVDCLTVSPGATPTTGVDDAIQHRTGEAADKARDATPDITDQARESGAKAGEKARETSDKVGDKAADAAGRTADAASDATVTSKVKAKFLADTGVSGLKIDVDSRAGVVTLTGTVPTAAEKRRALELAKDTEGVKSVVDKLKVGK